MIDRRFALRLVALTAVATALASCRAGTASPTGPSAVGPWAGAWQGPVTDVNGTSGTMRLTIEERPIDARRSLVSGTWAATFGDTSRDGAGTLGGTITDAIGTLLLTPTTPRPCDRTLFAPTGTYSAPQLTIAGRTIQGPFSQLLCTSTVTGTLTLTKP